MLKSEELIAHTHQINIMLLITVKMTKGKIKKSIEQLNKPVITFPRKSFNKINLNINQE